ncbi:MAG TPA: hypothetical protein VHH15_00140 [Actinophytocola sp.]|nr:hypothetical protein [Actinophytocola sp.]
MWLAPEDLIGVPRIVDGRSRFCPPEQIARDSPYVLFLDELNAASPDVQKAFYSLILDRRIGSYELPAGSHVDHRPAPLPQARHPRPCQRRRARRLAVRTGGRAAVDAVDGGPGAAGRPRRVLPPRADPPLPWDAQLARWFDEHVRSPEPRRTGRSW